MCLDRGEFLGFLLLPSGDKLGAGQVFKCIILQYKGQNIIGSCSSSSKKI